MNLEIDITVTEQYLDIKLTGKWDINELFGACEIIYYQAENHKKYYLIVDMLGVSIPESNFDRFLIGEQIALVSRGKHKIAVVYPGEAINRFAENTAVNRGAFIAAFPDRESASLWLVEEQVISESMV